MDIKRNLLILGLAIVSYLMLLAWNEDYPADTPPDIAAASGTQDTADTVNVGVDQGTNLPAPAATTNTANETVSEDLPTAPSSAKAAVDNDDAVVSAGTPAPSDSHVISVDTPKQIVTIDLLGGDIVGVALPDFPVSLDAPDEPFKLLRRDPELDYVAQSGLVGRDGPDGNAAGRPLYTAKQTSYTLDPSTDELAVDLAFTTAKGVEITKRFTFRPDDYLIDVEYLIDNRSDSPWQGNMFGQIKRDDSDDPSKTSGMRGSYLGAAINTPNDPYVKVKFKEIDEGVDPVETTGGWIAFSQHYFLGSWIPDSGTDNTYTMRRNSQGEYLLTFVAPPTIVAPGQTRTIKAGFWAGPKDQYRLDEISPDLDLTIDYGIFFFIASPIFWLLTQINGLVGNYGVSILLLTVVIKTILYPLSAKSFRSGAKMRRLAPKINELKDKYGDDKQKFMQAQLELWKKEQVNPFGGCLPMLLQMPVFLGILWVLRESVELRQASFILWYHDLSQMDPYFVLPILMGASMFVQQTLTPMQTADPAQAKVMKFMPLMFMLFFLWMPAGLALYYTANSMLSIVQMWFVTRQVEKSYKPKPT